MLANILTYGSIAVALAAAVGALTTKTCHVETVIAAPAEQIWDVLTDTAPTLTGTRLLLKFRATMRKVARF